MRGDGKKILVVDDEEHIRLLLHEELTEEGYTVEEAQGGEEALDKLSTFKPDLITLDIKMPGMDGLETLERIKEIHPDLPAIIVSAYDVFKKDPAALASDAYVVKSSDLTELRSTIKTIIDEKAMEYKGFSKQILNEKLTGELEKQIRDLREENKKLKETKLNKIAEFKELQSLLHGWVHDIRNNLVAISATVKYFAQADRKVLDKYVDHIQQNMEDIETKIDQLYEYVDYGVIRYDPINMIKLINDLVRKKQTYKKEIDINVNVHTTSEIEVMGNKNQINLVLNNIINNAIEASPKKSSIDITVEERAHKTKKYLAILIQDQGSGISESEIMRADEPTPVKHGKRGLGLPLSKYLIGKHSGTMAITRLTKGTLVSIELPIINSSVEE